MPIDLDRIALSIRDQLESAYADGAAFHIRVEAFHEKEELTQLQIGVMLGGPGQEAKWAALQMMPAIASATECDVLTMTSDAYALDGEYPGDLPDEWRQGGWMQRMVKEGRRDEFGITDSLMTVAVRREDQAISMITQNYGRGDHGELIWRNVSHLSEWEDTTFRAGGTSADQMRAAMRVPTLIEVMSKVTPDIITRADADLRRLHQVCALAKMLYAAWAERNHHVEMGIVIAAYTDDEKETLERSMSTIPPEFRMTI
jgi:hypothetical protein